ncbi:MAG: thioredoxin family protein, partial [Bacteroidia bacterium]|nr:thioredoxin family protein [Bacteroidia bacterium]
LALALKFLSNADLVWGTHLLDREIYIGAWIVIFFLLGMYLLGKITLPHDSEIQHISVPRLLLAALSFWFVTYLIPGLWGAPLKAISGFLPPMNSDVGVTVLEGLSTRTESKSEKGICGLPRKYNHLAKDTPPGFCTFYDLEEGLAYAKKVNKPVFLDFTGHTCANCRKMESTVWPNPEVKRILNEEYVMISLFADDSTPLDSIEITPDGKKLRTIGNKWQYLQEVKYGTSAQPQYVLLDSDMNLLAEPRSYDEDIPAYIEFLKTGLERFKSRKTN